MYRFLKAATAASGGVLMSALLLSAAPAAASVVYTFTGSAAQIGGASFSATLTLPDFITSDLAGTDWDSCSVGDGSVYTCLAPEFDSAPNRFNTSSGENDDDLIVLNLAEVLGGSVGLFFFFGPGTLGSIGTHAADALAQNTPGYGSAGPATLTVSSAVVPLPAGLPLLLGALGGLGLLRRTRA